MTETPLPESPPASSQKYSTPVKQLEEILEARDKEQRGEAPVLNGVCIHVYVCSCLVAFCVSCVSVCVLVCQCACACV